MKYRGRDLLLGVAAGATACIMLAVPVWLFLEIGRFSLSRRAVLDRTVRQDLDIAAALTDPAGTLLPHSIDENMITGQIQLQGKPSATGAAIVTGNGQSVTPADDGTFQFSGGESGTYEFTVSAPGYVSAHVAGANAAEAGGVNAGQILLPAGDANADNVVDIFDLAAIASPANRQNMSLDYNNDGRTDQRDVEIAAQNLDVQGPVEGSLDQALRSVIGKNHLTALTPPPPANPATVELGRMLYFDKLLSGNRDTACATCHLPSAGTSDNLSLSIGTGGAGIGAHRTRAAGHSFIPRNAPDVFNRGQPEWSSMFWDSRVAGNPQDGFTTPAGPALPDGLENVLAAQAMFPVTARSEMRGFAGDIDVLGRANELAVIPDENLPDIWSGIMRRVLDNPAYADMFAAAFPDVPPEARGFEHAANAIATFETAAFTFTRSPWDRYLAGDNTALSNSAKQGALLFFGKANCSACHSGNLFTDQRHHNICTPQLGPGKGEEAPQDFGRGRETQTPVDRFAFRTPPLRNVTLSGPWMHAGAFNSLQAAVLHHLSPELSLRTFNLINLRPELRDTVQLDADAVGAMLQNIDPLMSRPINLSAEEFTQLIAFLESLTDPAAATLDHVAPHAVPSGLPIDK